MGNNDPQLMTKFIHFLQVLRPQLICDIGSMDAGAGARFKHISPASRVISFEANPYNFAATLKSRFAAVNGVEWEYIAISNIDGIVNFNATSYARDQTGELWTLGGSSLLHRMRQDIPFEKVTVPCTRLDTYLEEKDLLHCGKALWIDVEGAGDLVLEGATESLKTTLLLHIEVESKEMFTGQKLDRHIIPYLEAMGFIPISSGDEGGDVQYDVLLISKKLLTLVVD